MQIWPTNCKMQTPNKSMLAAGWVHKYLREGINSPVTAALVNTKKNAHLLAAVKRWLAVGLNVTLE